MKMKHYRQKVAEKSLVEIIADRLRCYKQSFQMNNWFIGRLIELTGNHVWIDGVKLSVDNPLVMTRHKSTLFFQIYEIKVRALTKRYIDPDLPTVEIGGSIGGVACTTNKLLRFPREHVVVECNPYVLPTLERNRVLNSCPFSIEPLALAYAADTVTFTVALDHFMMGRLHGSGGMQIEVKAITLREIIRKYNFKVINLISDSEGGEVEMVDQDEDIMRECVKWFIVETHAGERGSTLIRAMISKLENIGFVTEEAQVDVLAMRNSNL
ncbi:MULTISPECIES: FkbM family methyltransferase [unclassified Bradyrhizobium]